MDNINDYQISYIMQENHHSKIQRIGLELNKTGLSYLLNQANSSNSYQYFKKAQKILLAQVQVDPTQKSVQRLLAVTYNNLAIYYKRTNKPKAALTYLKNALEIQTFILEDWLATATTHLNICAIYSFMKKHQQAIDHANLSIENAHKTKKLVEKDVNIQKSCSNVQLASMYNLAVQYEHLKKYQEAIQAYKRSSQKAKVLGRKNIQTNSQESIERLSSEMTKNRRKLVELLQKKKENEEKGNYESMRRNKKNFKPVNDQQLIKADKYEAYNQDGKKTQSVTKLLTLKPIRSQSTDGIKKWEQVQRKGKKDSGRDIKIKRG